MLLLLGILILIAFPITLFYGHYRFYNSVENEVSSMFNISGVKESLVTKKDLEAVPEKLRDYLLKVGVIGKCKGCHVTFKQNGQIKTAQDKKWTDFTATQYMTADSPNFIWSARAFPMFVRDKSINGKGEVKVSLFGLKDIAKSDGHKTNESALTRCLGELLFYPVGFLSDAISWEELENGSLKATIQVGNITTEGVFLFNEDGLLYRFESKRYMNETLEDFTGIAEDYQMKNGFFIPTKMRAIWNLKDGDFEYFNCKITEYNID
ncbi:MAG: DUF6544 family protein [Maribacter sp.]